MPELPDLEIYRRALERRILGEHLEGVRLASPSLLRSVDPPLEEARGREVLALGRLGKRLVIGLEDELFLVIHLMVAGRLHWKKPGAALPRRRTHAAFDFSSGTLLLSEASTRKRARLHLVRGRDGLAAQPGRAKGATTAGLAALPVGAGEREEHSGYNGPP